MKQKIPEWFDINNYQDLEDLSRHELRAVVKARQSLYFKVAEMIQSGCDGEEVKDYYARTLIGKDYFKEHDVDGDMADFFDEPFSLAEQSLLSVGTKTPTVRSFDFNDHLALHEASLKNNCRTSLLTSLLGMTYKNKHLAKNFRERMPFIERLRRIRKLLRLHAEQQAYDFGEL